jgi:hypothetical protein
MSLMLFIAGERLPRSDLTYLAFRVAFLETLERIVLSRQFDDSIEVFGFLTEVPFLTGVAPHVQLDLLADTWSRHSSRRRIQASLVDESIIYAACETAARVAGSEPTVITHCMITGPKACSVEVDGFLPGELRNLHLGLANEGDFLLISQFEDLEPDDAADLKEQFRLDLQRLDEMFDALGRWYVQPHLAARLDGLLTDRELQRADYVISDLLQPREASE